MLLLSSMITQALQPVGGPYATASRLVPTSLFETPTGRNSLLKVLMELFNTDTSPIIFAVAPHYFKSDGLTSVTDAWRNSLWHASPT